MAEVTVLLIAWEHMCCGEQRSVGDFAEFRVHRSENGQLYEDRHSEALETTTEPLTGIVTGIKWRPAIMKRESLYGSKVVGYESGVSVASTDFAPSGDPSRGAFELTVHVRTGIT